MKTELLILNKILDILVIEYICHCLHH